MEHPVSLVSVCQTATLTTKQYVAVDFGDDGGIGTDDNKGDAFRCLSFISLLKNIVLLYMYIFWPLFFNDQNFSENCRICTDK